MVGSDPWYSRPTVDSELVGGLDVEQVFRQRSGNQPLAIIGLLYVGSPAPET
jgi:hypothetical protein